MFLPVVLVLLSLQLTFVPSVLFSHIQLSLEREAFLLKLEFEKQIEISKTYFEKYSMVARKTLEVLELDPTLFDRFTKRQKHKMMLLKSDPPRVKAKTGHSIPRHYIRKIQQEIYDIIKIYPVNNDTASDC